MDSKIEPIEKESLDKNSYIDEILRLQKSGNITIEQAAKSLAQLSISPEVNQRTLDWAKKFPRYIRKRAIAKNYRNTMDSLKPAVIKAYDNLKIQLRDTTDGMKVSNDTLETFILDTIMTYLEDNDE